MVYDARCGFCRARVAQLRWFDSGKRLDYVSLHDPDVSERFPELPSQRLLDEMCVVTPAGSEFWGADAVRYLSRRLPTLWWLAPAMHLPGAMLAWRPLYRWVSRNRYFLGGRVEACDSGRCRLDEGATT